MTAKQIVNRYINFFEKLGHKQIINAPLVPDNDPTTLFISSGMQPLVPYLLGEIHPSGTRLVNIQNSFRAQDIEEIGDNRHTTFFRMIGNWSLGDYFKKEQLPWFFEFLTKELKLDPRKLYVTVFAGDKNFRVLKNDNYQNLTSDLESANIWKKLFEKENINAEIANAVNESPDILKGRIFYYGANKNWWSRSGTPDKMPIGEPGGPDSEVFYDFGEELKLHEKSSFKDSLCHPNCDCGRFLEIGNSVFMQYKKINDNTFEELPKQNVDFGGGLERLVAVTENMQDMFQTSLFSPIIKVIENKTGMDYKTYPMQMRIITDHITAGIFIASNNVAPSNKEQGYILRRLIRRGLDHLQELTNQLFWDQKKLQDSISSILEAVVEQYKDTDPILVEKYEHIKGIVLEEEQKYYRAKEGAKKYIEKKYPPPVILNEGSTRRPEVKNPLKTEQEIHPKGTFPQGDYPLRGVGYKVAALRFTQNDKERLFGDELMGTKEISADDAYILYSTHGLSPTQIKSLGYTFNEQLFAEKMKSHKDLSRTASAGKFKGGLLDQEELTIKGHTATHLLQQALRDVLGNHVFQTGSNITAKRLRFDFSHNNKLSDQEIKKAEEIVKNKILENLPVHYEMLPLKKAKDIGAIGLFDDKYQDNVKVYFIGNYSKEFCGGPHVASTKEIKSFAIIKQEKIGQGQIRLYAIVS